MSGQPGCKILLLSFLRKPFGKPFGWPFGQLRVVSLSNRLTALSLSKGQESTGSEFLKPRNDESAGTGLRSKSRNDKGFSPPTKRNREPMQTFKKFRTVSAAFAATLFAAFLFLAGFSGQVADAASAGSAETGKPAPAQTEFRRLEGKWVRPDGGYVLELRNIKKDEASRLPITTRGRSGSFVRNGAEMTAGSTCLSNCAMSTTPVRPIPCSTNRHRIGSRERTFSVQRQTFDIEFVRVR